MRIYSQPDEAALDVDELASQLDQQSCAGCWRVTPQALRPQRSINGCLLRSASPQAADSLRTSIYQEGEIADAFVTNPDLRPGQLCLLSLDGGSIEAAGIVSGVDHKVRLTSKMRVTVRAIQPFEEALDPTAGLLSRLTPGTSELVKRALQTDATVFRHVAWRELRRVLAQLRPDISAILDDLETFGLGLPEVIPDPEQTMREERDAFAFTLMSGGFERRRYVTRLPDEPTRYFGVFRDLPVLEAASDLKPRTVIEDRMIEHDVAHFPGWESLVSNSLGVSRFARRNQQGRLEALTVMNVNRDSVEHIAGVDLVYHHASYDSYLIVQYKRFRLVQRPNGTLAQVFAVPGDAKFQAQLQKMRGIECYPDDGDYMSFRLLDDACYLKLCNPSRNASRGSDLVDGIYLPVTFWDRIASYPPFQPGRIHREGVRHLTNSQMVGLVQDGFIGSRGLREADVHKWVEAAIDDADSVLIAEYASL